MLIEYRRDGRVFVNGRLVGRSQNPENLLSNLLTAITPRRPEAPPA